MLNWIRTLKDLSTVKRYSRAELAKPENVMEHTGYVALLSLHIANGLIAEGFEIDLGNLLTKALVHDIDESLSGDVQRPTKYFSQEMREEFGKMEFSIAKHIFHHAGDDNYSLMTAWKMQKTGNTGAIVAFADSIAVLIKTHDEIVLRGNKSMSQVIQSLGFPSCFEKLNALRDSFPNSKIIREYTSSCRIMVSEIRENK